MPKPWIILTVEQLDTAKAAALVIALRTAALGDGQSDPLPEIITAVTDRIRMEIAAGGKTRLSADPAKLPPSLKSLALRFVLREGQGRLNAMGAMPLADDEKEEWRQDVRLLERIARGEITVEEPDDPEQTPSVQAGASTPMLAGRQRHWGRANQEGV